MMRALVALLVLVQACRASEAQPPSHGAAMQPADTQGGAMQGGAIDKAAVDAVNAFGLDLHRRLSTSNAGSNVFTSPFSMHAALAMTMTGARGKTEAEMGTVLHLPVGNPAARAGSGRLARALSSGNRPYELAIANRLFGDEKARFEAAFLDAVAREFDAPLEKKDFRNATEKARVDINAWVEETTRQRIQELLAPGVLTPSTRLVLVNAIYFKGTWLARFDPASTTDGTFKTAGGPRPVKMMSRRGHMTYGADDLAQYVELPYVGGELAMLVVLPRAADGLAVLESHLSPRLLEAWTSRLSTRKVALKLPRFRITFGQDMKPVLKDAGMPSAFNDGADFSGISTSDALMISAVVHKAFVDVNEEGTEAAAATAVVMARKAVEDVEDFNADHPFLFLIRHKATGAVLFIGRFVQP